MAGEGAGLSGIFRVSWLVASFNRNHLKDDFCVSLEDAPPTPPAPPEPPAPPRLTIARVGQMTDGEWPLEPTKNQMTLHL